jgi:hypothetical protein
MVLFNNRFRLCELCVSAVKSVAVVGVGLRVVAAFCGQPGCIYVIRSHNWQWPVRTGIGPRFTGFRS